ncbi:hypothetical protein J6590_012056 [Homalodisca vitripennis]|nr:hypothetical protein J6590_012056 [Homalodisca vitripennis]
MRKRVLNGLATEFKQWECICARSVGLPCGLPTKPPTGHGEPRPEPFRMTSCLVRVSYVPSRTKLLVSEARGQSSIRLHDLMKDRMYMSGD